MAKARKPLYEMIVPGASNWERWLAPEGGTGSLADSIVLGEETKFGNQSARRVLVLPVSHAWVMPAWLKGDASLVKDMALLHLERLGIRIDEPNRALSLLEVTRKDDAGLVTLLALKDEETPITATSTMPDEVVLSAAVLPLEPSGITVWRELGRLVMGITSGGRLVYASPLTATRFDERSLGELNNVCLQLGFQRVLGRVEQMVLWLPEGEGDLAVIERTVGLPVRREAPPSWKAIPKGGSQLMPADLHDAGQSQETSRRRRIVALSAGAFIAAAIALMSVLITLELRQRNDLLEQVASLSPKAARVLDQKRAWQEAAPAVDPSQGPLQFLLGLQEPSSSIDVTLLDLDFTPKQVMVRAHSAEAATALQYAEEIQQAEQLFAYSWETPPPEMAADESATFELKGARP